MTQVQERWDELHKYVELHLRELAIDIQHLNQEGQMHPEATVLKTAVRKAGAISEGRGLALVESLVMSEILDWYINSFTNIYSKRSN